MSDSELVVLTASLTLNAYPHARIDCPDLLSPRRSAPPVAPCPLCYCYVCDVPLSSCDDAAAHGLADGRDAAWQAEKRRRAAVYGYSDVAELVERIIFFAVDESRRNNPRRAVQLSEENRGALSSVVDLNILSSDEEDEQKTAFIEENNKTGIGGLYSIPRTTGGTDATRGDSSDVLQSRTTIKLE